jgi:hypothetical protein
MLIDRGISKSTYTDPVKELEGNEVCGAILASEIRSHILIL